MQFFKEYYNLPNTWWRHQMETFSELLALFEGNPPVTGGFPSPSPVTWSFDVFLDLRLNNRLSKQSWGWWFETPSRPLWRNCNVVDNMAKIWISRYAIFQAVLYFAEHMIASSNGNIFRVTGPLWGESTGHRWIPQTQSSDAELWCFLWSAPEQTA